jgi:hypothetical protein
VSSKSTKVPKKHKYKFSTFSRANQGDRKELAWPRLDPRRHSLHHREIASQLPRDLLARLPLALRLVHCHLRHLWCHLLLPAASPQVRSLLLDPHRHLGCAVARRARHHLVNFHRVDPVKLNRADLAVGGVLLGLWSDAARHFHGRHEDSGHTVRWLVFINVFFWLKTF